MLSGKHEWPKNRYGLTRLYLLISWWVSEVVCAVVFVGHGTHAALRPCFQASWRRGSSCVQIWWVVIRGDRGVTLGQIQSLVAKRVRTRVRRRRVSHIRGSGEHRAFGAPMNGNCTLWTLRVVWLKALSLLRFFVALDKEMTCRHAQWLTVIKRKSDSRRPLTLKATTRH